MRHTEPTFPVITKNLFDVGGRQRAQERARTRAKERAREQASKQASEREREGAIKGDYAEALRPD